MPSTILAVQNEPTEWSYVSARGYADPFNEIDMDVIIADASGHTWRVPAWWAGGNAWRVRFAPPLPGRYTINTVCSDPANPALHNRTGLLEASPYSGTNPLLLHGAPRVAASRRTFEHADGTPFFWLGDTWWMGLCNRWSWPGDFQQVTADRVAKGFTVVQIVAGLYPDMPGFDERGANEAGFPWEKDYARINPAWFDMADLRIQWLVRCGIVPCIVGSWGYYLPFLGTAKMKQHWRYLVARWAAWPVVWCLAGEGTMPYYLSKDKDADRQAQLQGWTDVGRYVRQVDPCHRLVSIHSAHGQSSRDQVTDGTIVDFDMLQTGHGGYGSVTNTIAAVLKQLGCQPPMPVLPDEVSYEGILHDSQAEVQRLLFWTSMLSGAAGFTYGANGIWQINTRRKPYGQSPWGGNYGNVPWEDACQLPGSRHLGLAKRLLERYPWWQLEPHQEWVKPAGTPADWNGLFAAGIPGQVRLIYLYNPSWRPGAYCVEGLEPGIRCRAFFWDPCSAAEHEVGVVAADARGSWPIPLQPTMSDWLLVLDRVESR